MASMLKLIISDLIAWQVWMLLAASLFFQNWRKVTYKNLR